MDLVQGLSGRPCPGAQWDGSFNPISFMGHRHTGPDKMPQNAALDKGLQCFGMFYQYLNKMKNTFKQPLYW